VESQADASEQILKELQRVIASQERMRAEVTAEVQQVHAEVKVWHAAMGKWRTEMEKTVRTVELNEAQLRTQILGTAEGLVRVEQKLQQEVAKMCAKLEMMQNEQEKKKGNEEAWLNALVREHVEKLAQQLEEKEDVGVGGGISDEHNASGLLGFAVRKVQRRLNCLWPICTRVTFALDSAHEFDEACRIVCPRRGLKHLGNVERERQQPLVSSRRTHAQGRKDNDKTQGHMHNAQARRHSAVHEHRHCNT
jgi:hypothetical protein